MPQAIVALAFPALVGTTAGAVLTGVVSVGLSFGVSLVAGQLFGPDVPKPEDLQGVVRQSVNARMRHYGRVRIGGPLAFIETNDGRLYQIVIHGQGPFDAYEAIYIDNRLVERNTDGGIITDPYSSGDQVILDRLGTSSQAAIDALVAAFPTIWSTDHRLRGIAHSYMRADSVDAEDVNEVYPNRIPVIGRVIRGALCYDPRSASSVWTRNAFLILRDYLTHPDGMNLPESWIDDYLVAAAADVADQNLTTRSGEVIKRYAIGLSYSFDEEPKDVISRILAATDGRLFLTGEGKIGMLAGKWVAPTVTITDAHILDYEMTDGSGPFRETNEIIVKYTQVPVGYKAATSDPWRDEDSISLLGDIRSQSPELYEIQHHNHARRIAKILMARSNPRWQGTVVTNLYGMNAWDQRFITLKIADLEIDETFEIIGEPSLDAGSMTVTLQVQSFPSSAYDFDAASEEGTEPTIPDDYDEPTIPEPTGVVSSSEFRKVGDVDAGGTPTDVKVYVGVLNWAAPPRKGLYAEAQYSLNGGFDWLGMTVASKGRQAETPALPRPSTVKLQVRWRANGGGHSDWVDADTITIPA